MSSHRVSLYLSRNESPADSPKDLPETYSSSFSKATEIVARAGELLERNRAESLKQESQEKDVIFYKKLVKQLQKEKKELEDKNRELAQIVKESKPKPGLEKVVEKTQTFLTSANEKLSKSASKNLGSRAEFLALVKTNNLQEALIRTLNFSQDLLKNLKKEGKSGSGSPRSHLAHLIEDDLSLLTKDQIQVFPLKKLSEKVEIDSEDFYEPEI